LWCRLHDLEQRLVERIAAAYSPDQWQEDLNQCRRNDPQDNQGDDGSLRIAMLEEAIDNTSCADAGSVHHRCGEQSEGEPTELRIEVVHSPTLSTVTRATSGRAGGDGRTA
jgi:hypothetical protein